MIRKKIFNTKKIKREYIRIKLVDTFCITNKNITFMVMNNIEKTMNNQCITTEGKNMDIDVLDDQEKKTHCLTRSG